MTAEFKQRIHDCIEACRAIQSFTKGVSLDDYSRNLMLRSAVERQFEILGEALNRTFAIRAGKRLFSPSRPLKTPMIFGFSS